MNEIYASEVTAQARPKRVWKASMDPGTLTLTPVDGFVMYRAVALLAVLVTFLVPAWADERPEFVPLCDDRGDFSFTFDATQEIRYTVSRQNVDGPYYDGLHGYNVIKIRTEKLPYRMGRPQDVLTLLVEGQYRLFGFAPGSTRVFAYRLVQFGSIDLIDNIVLFDPSNRSGLPIGPRGGYQYGAPTPDGRFSVLVSTGMTIVDLDNGQSRRIDVTPPIGNAAADPSDPPYISGNANLTGRHMEALWTTHRSGRLLVRDKHGLVKREIEMDIDPGS